MIKIINAFFDPISKKTFLAKNRSVHNRNDTYKKKLSLLNFDEFVEEK